MSASKALSDLAKEDRRAVFENMTVREQIAYQRERDKIAIESPDYNASVVKRARERMARVDQFPPDVRALVHEFGLEVVQEFWNHNIRRPNAMRHLIETVQGKYADGRNKIRPNVKPAARQNPTNAERDIPLPSRYHRS